MQFWTLSNGRLLQAEEATVSLLDQSYQFGLGLFETILWDGSQLAEWDDHMQRLISSCRTLLNIELDLSGIEALTEALTEKSDSDLQRVKVCVSLVEEGAKVNISSQAYLKPPGDAKLLLSSYRVNEFSAVVGHKTTCYANYLLALKESLSRGANEALMLNSKGQVSECATSNLFFLTDGKWHTPSLDTGCLPGVMRAHILDFFTKSKIDLVEGEFTFDDLMAAESVFISNSLRRIQEVSSIDTTSFSTGENAEVNMLISKYGN